MKAILIASFLFSGVAFGQTGACKTERAKYCKKAKKTAYVVCMRKVKSKLSTKCAKRVEKRAKQLGL